jgi:hypothetical protein
MGDPAGDPRRWPVASGMGDSELPLLTFTDAAAFLQWLEANGETSSGVWLRFAKRGAPERTVSKTKAIDCALACGWVDGQLGRLDEHFFKTRFTPRRPGSAWSQVNRERVETLERAGWMQPAGREQEHSHMFLNRHKCLIVPPDTSGPASFVRRLDHRAAVRSRVPSASSG